MTTQATSAAARLSEHERAVYTYYNAALRLAFRTTTVRDWREANAALKALHVARHYRALHETDLCNRLRAML